MKQEQRDGYLLERFPRSRLVIIDSARIGHRKHTTHALVEFDVTKARQIMRGHKEKTGEIPSFTAFIIGCLGKAVDADRHVHAYRNWRGQLVIFDEVDVTTLIEVELEGKKFPLAHILRGANRRTFWDLHEEIRSVQAHPVDSPSLRRGKSINFFLYLPAFVRDIFYRFVQKNPHLLKKNVGTVVVTAVGMFGKGGGWGISLPTHTLNVVVGGIAEKLALLDGQVERREFVCLTIDFDHDIVDGAPAARFVQRFKELVESAHGLA